MEDGFWSFVLRTLARDLLPKMLVGFVLGVLTLKVLRYIYAPAQPPAHVVILTAMSASAVVVLVLLALFPPRSKRSDK